MDAIERDEAAIELGGVYYYPYHGEVWICVFLALAHTHRDVCQPSTPKKELDIILNVPIFVQTIFELQIAFNGIKFHIFPLYYGAPIHHSRERVKE